MNQPNTTPGLSLPSLSPSESSYEAPNLSTPTPETPAARPEMAPMPKPTNPQQPVNLQPLSQPSTATLPVGRDTQSVTPAAPTATDDDLDDESLDAEWVSKAKAIVEQTQSDPYKESRALSQIRAEYLRRRHGKEIKVHDAK